MRSISISHPFPHSHTNSLTNTLSDSLISQDVLSSQSVKTEPVTTFLYASGILALPSFPLSPQLQIPPLHPPLPLPPQPAKIKDKKKETILGL